MENSNIIENDTKVLDFMAMTETGDPEVAKKYLESAKWDVTTAVNAFYSKINVNNNAQRNNININNNNNALNRNLNNNQNNNEEDDGFLSKYIISPISSVFNAIFGSCKEKRDIERREKEAEKQREKDEKDSRYIPGSGIYEGQTASLLCRKAGAKKRIRTCPR